MPALFLHMGPGMNAGAERLLLQNDTAYATVDFWDQPACSEPDAFAVIVRAATDRAEAMAHAHGGPIDLIAHSFGGHFAREIIRLRPEIVQSIRLISTGPGLAGQFLRLLGFLSRDSETPPELAAEMQSLLRQISDDGESRIWEMIGLITRDPSFMRLYWPDRALFDAYTRVTHGLPPLHPETFGSVVKDFLKYPDHMPTRMAWKGKAELILGANDPLIDVEKAKAYWLCLFPELGIEIREASGHFPHLETALAKQMK